METTKRQQRLERVYDCDIDVLLAKKYEDDGYSQPELASELSSHLPDGETVPRSTLQYWLREAGVEMRRRTLTDVQRVAIMVLLPHLPNHRIAERVGCATVTVARYRRELRETGTPAALDLSLTERDRDLLRPDSASQWVRAPDSPTGDDTGVPATDGGEPDDAAEPRD